MPRLAAWVVLAVAAAGCGKAALPPTYELDLTARSRGSSRAAPQAEAPPGSPEATPRPGPPEPPR